MKEQIFCGIVIFTYVGFDEGELGEIQFYNVQFPFKSMEKYNGVTAALGINGQLTLFDDENGNEIDDMWVTEIPEVKERILKGE
ncbi:hypothetical protein [Blautia intestinalis]|uniref:hypothetical protein n=1 Tax=Blautia intestinalis TaxID=2763028 RepID=UPI0022E7D90F|nr:hypothetical protein [Blautia intestinalis]